MSKDETRKKNQLHKNDGEKKLKRDINFQLEG
jgi:hypothetical protein